MKFFLISIFLISVVVKVGEASDELHCFYNLIKDLSLLDFTGYTPEYVASDSVNCDEIIAKERAAKEEMFTSQLILEEFAESVKECLKKEIKDTKIFEWLLADEVVRGLDFVPKIEQDKLNEFNEILTKQDVVMGGKFKACLEVSE